MAAPRSCRWKCARSAPPARPPAAPAAPGQTPAAPATPGAAPRPATQARQPGAPAARALTATELAVRARVLAEQQREAARREQERREQEKISILSAAEEARRREEEAKRAAEEEARRAEAEARKQAEEEAARAAAELAATTQSTVSVPATSPAADARQQPARPATGTPGARPAAPATPGETLRLKPTTPRPASDDDEAPRRRPGIVLPGRKPGVAVPKKVGDDRRRAGRIDVQAAIEGEDEKSRSLASVRRQRERERRQAELEMLRSDQMKVVRDVVVPETITVQDLAARMAARMPDVIKSLMKMGVMATPAQSLDADTAELVVQEFGHRVRRVSEADVELGIDGAEDVDTELEPRPPVVTIMGHVDHGKTQPARRAAKTDVAAGEAGGITQHIGAYTVKTKAGNQITFIDTPGHEAFTAMRSRGASVTDIVVLVVAADDGVMPQTIEAIRHAKAADAPIIVAINKMDRPDANPNRVRQELLATTSSWKKWAATRRTWRSRHQADRPRGAREGDHAAGRDSRAAANPDRAAEGSVIESRLDRGRGPVATVLVQKGTLRQGDIVVAGAEWGKVRAMLDDKGQQVKRRPLEPGGNPRSVQRAERRASPSSRSRTRPGARDQRVPPAQGA